MAQEPLSDRELRILRGLMDEHLERLRHGARGNGGVTVIMHALVAIALLAGYVALTIHGDDATLLLSALVAYLAGAGAHKVLRRNGP